MARQHSPSSSNPSNDREFAVILEEINAQFKTFGEGFSGIRQWIERIEPKIDQMAEDVELIKLVGRKNTDDIQILKGWTHNFNKDSESLKLEFKLLRDDVKAFMKRLEVVETKVGL